MSTTVSKCISSTFILITSSTGISDGTYYFPEDVCNVDCCVYQLCFGSTSLSRSAHNISSTKHLKVTNGTKTRCINTFDSSAGLVLLDTLCRNTTTPRITTDKIISIPNDFIRTYKGTDNTKEVYIKGYCAYNCYSCVIPSGYYSSEQLWYYLCTLTNNTWLKTNIACVSLIATCLYANGCSTQEIVYSGRCGLAHSMYYCLNCSQSPYPSLYKTFDRIYLACTCSGCSKVIIFTCGTGECYCNTTTNNWANVSVFSAALCGWSGCTGYAAGLVAYPHSKSCIGVYTNASHLYGVYIPSIVCFC